MNQKRTLLKEHVHAGVLYPPGTEIDVTAPEAAWLEEQGVIEKIAAPSTAKRAPHQNEVEAK